MYETSLLSIYEMSGLYPVDDVSSIGETDILSRDIEHLQKRMNVGRQMCFHLIEEQKITYQPATYNVQHNNYTTRMVGCTGTYGYDVGFSRRCEREHDMIRRTIQQYGVTDWNELREVDSIPYPEDTIMVDRSRFSTRPHHTITTTSPDQQRTVTKHTAYYIIVKYDGTSSYRVILTQILRQQEKYIRGEMERPAYNLPATVLYKISEYLGQEEKDSLCCEKCEYTECATCSRIYSMMSKV